MSNLCHPLLPPPAGPFFHTLGVSLSEDQHLILALLHPEAHSLWSHSLLACVASTLTRVPFTSSHTCTPLYCPAPSPPCAPLVDTPLFSGSEGLPSSHVLFPSHLHGISASLVLLPHPYAVVHVTLWVSLVFLLNFEGSLRDSVLSLYSQYLPLCFTQKTCWFYTKTQHCGL